MSLLESLETLNEEKAIKTAVFDSKSAIMNEYHRAAGDLRLKRAAILRSMGNIDAATFQEDLAKEHLEK